MLAPDWPTSLAAHPLPLTSLTSLSGQIHFCHRAFAHVTFHLKFIALNSSKAYLCSFGSQLRSHLFLEVCPDYLVQSGSHPRLATIAPYFVE